MDPVSLNIKTGSLFNNIIYLRSNMRRRRSYVYVDMIVHERNISSAYLRTELLRRFLLLQDKLNQFSLSLSIPGTGVPAQGPARTRHNPAFEDNSATHLAFSPTRAIYGVSPIKGHSLLSLWCMILYNHPFSLRYSCCREVSVSECQLAKHRRLTIGEVPHSHCSL